LSDTQFPRWPLYLSGLFGLAYLVFGFVYLLSGVGVIMPLPGASDPIASLMLVIVSIVYLSGTPMLSRGDREGYAFPLVATILAALLFFLQILVLASDTLGWLLGFSDWATWTALQDASPSLWLFLLVLTTMAFLKFSNRLGGEKGIFPIVGD
jgi:hypothetical protein